MKDDGQSPRNKQFTMFNFVRNYKETSHFADKHGKQLGELVASYRERCDAVLLGD
jgi:hypothetical protein